MRRDNEHCEVIIQDKLVEYQRTHTLEIAPVHTHTLEMAPVHTASCSKLQITRQEIASLAICAQPQIFKFRMTGFMVIGQRILQVGLCPLFMFLFIFLFFT